MTWPYDHPDWPEGCFPMNEVVDILRDTFGIFSVLEMTGGNTATLYAGKLEGNRFEAAAGPGVFAWVEGLPSPGNVNDFYVGPDDSGNTDVYMSLAGITPVDAPLVVAAMMAGTVLATRKARADNPPEPNEYHA